MFLMESYVMNCRMRRNWGKYWDLPMHAEQSPLPRKERSLLCRMNQKSCNYWKEHKTWWDYYRFHVSRFLQVCCNNLICTREHWEGFFSSFCFLLNLISNSQGLFCSFCAPKDAMWFMLDDDDLWIAFQEFDLQPHRYPHLAAPFDPSFHASKKCSNPRLLLPSLGHITRHRKTGSNILPQA